MLKRKPKQRRFWFLTGASDAACWLASGGGHVPVGASNKQSRARGLVLNLRALQGKAEVMAQAPLGVSWHADRVEGALRGNVTRRYKRWPAC